MTETLQSVLHHTLVSRWAGCATEEKLYAKGLELIGLMKSTKDFTPIGWGNIRAALQAQGNAPSSINNKLSVWRCLAQSAVEMGLIQAVPRVKKERQQENPELSEQEGAGPGQVTRPDAPDVALEERQDSVYRVLHHARLPMCRLHGPRPSHRHPIDTYRRTDTNARA